MDDVGARLRYIRQQHKLSQRELAKRVGIPNSTISLIESNRSNPSVSLLKRILDGIAIRMADFFACEPANAGKIFYSGDELLEIGSRKISFLQVGKNLFGRSLQILKEKV